MVTQFMFGDTTPTLGTGVSWFLVKSNFDNINAASANVASANFNNSQTYILTDNSSTGSTVTTVPAGWNAIGGIDFKSFAELQTAIQNGWVTQASASANLQALSYDDENWSFTPSTEQKNAATYEALFANLSRMPTILRFVSPPSQDLWIEYPGFSNYPSGWVANLNQDCPSTDDPNGPYGTTGTTFPSFLGHGAGQIFIESPIPDSLSGNQCHELLRLRL